MKRIAVWLALRELTARPAAAALALLSMAVGAAVVVSTESLSLAREGAVAEAVDQIGASIRLAPRGVSGSDLARLDTRGLHLPAGTLERARRAVAGTGRRLRPAWFVPTELEGVDCALVADPADEVAPEGAARRDEITLGPELARKSGVHAGALVTVAGSLVRVADVLPARGNADDLAAFASASFSERLAATSEPSVVDVYLRPGEDVARLAGLLRSAAPDVNVVEVRRGDLADGGLHRELLQHRNLVGLAVAVVVGLVMAIATHLDAAERRRELATLLAIGAGGLTIAMSLTVRTTVLGVAGAVAGALAVLVTATVPSGDPGGMLRAAMPIAMAIVLAAAFVSALASLPTAVGAARLSPVAELQGEDP